MDRFCQLIKPFIKIIKFTGSIVCYTTCIFNLYANTVVEQVETYINSIDSLSAEFLQTSSNDTEVDTGSISIRRKSKNTKTEVSVKYKTGVISSMSLSGRFMTIVDRKTNRSKTYSILTTPIYAILAGELKLKDLKYQVLEDTAQSVIIRIIYERQTIDLLFDKANKNVNKLLSWTIYNGNGWTNVEFDRSTYSVTAKTTKAKPIKSVNVN